MTGGFGRFVLRGVGDRNTRSIMVDVGGTFVLPVDVTGGAGVKEQLLVPSSFFFFFWASMAIGPFVLTEVAARMVVCCWGYVCMQFGKGGGAILSACVHVFFF